MVSTGSLGVQELVERWTRRTPDQCAVRDSSTSEELTYAQLWRRSGQLAQELIDAGVGPGEFVGIGLDRGLDLVVAMLGVVRAGAAYLPLDRHAPVGRQAGLLHEAGVTTMVLADPGRSGSSASEWARPNGIRVVVVKPGPPSGPEPSLPAAPDGDAIIYVMYTSGSTGRPKGVVVPHRAVTRLVVEPNYCTLEPGERVANASNPAFDATTFEVWGALANGATVVVIPAITDLGMDEWEALIRPERITTMFLTTALFQTVARERPGLFASFRTVLFGGEHVDPAAVRRVLAAGPPARLVNIYGPTETTTFATRFDCTADSLAGLDRLPVGHPLQHTSVVILDDDLGPTAEGEIGELCIGGPAVALGYLNRPELTAQRFVTQARHGVLYRTGDLARHLADGGVELLGRRDRQVKLRGFRIELEEIERVATATGLLDAAVVEKVGQGSSAVLVGFALPAAPVPAGDDLGGELSRRLAQELPDYMLPVRWLVLDRLPLTSTGKIDRARLLTGLESSAEPVGESPLRAGETDPQDEQIRSLWLALLGVPSVSDADNFLSLGGNSIIAIQLAARIEQHLGLRVEPAEILLSDSLADLNRQLREVRGAASVSTPR